MKYLPHIPCGPFLVLLFSLTLSQVYAQVPKWRSAVVVPGVSSITSVASADSSTVYIAGSFVETAIFGEISLTSVGKSDAFVAKWNNVTGHFVWAQRLGGAGSDEASAVGLSGKSVYVAGDFSSDKASIGSAVLVNARTSSTSNSSDVFVLKLTDEGSTSKVEWAKQAGGIDYEHASALAVAGTSIYVVGRFRSLTARFGTTTLVNTSPSSDVFVTKLTDLGRSAAFTWAQQAGGASSDEASAVTVNGSSVYITGYFSSDYNGSKEAGFGNSVLLNKGGLDVFVAKLTDAGTSGRFVWAVSAGGTDGDVANTIAINGSSIYVAGLFRSTTAVFGTTVMKSSGKFDVFVAKLTDVGTSGRFAWAQRAGGRGGSEATAIGVTGANVYVAGYSTAAASFGSTSLVGITSLANPAGHFLFLTKLVDDGLGARFIWAKRAKNHWRDKIGAVAVAGTKIFVVGTVSPPAAFGVHAVVGPLESSVGFIATVNDTLLGGHP